MSNQTFIPFIISLEQQVHVCWLRFIITASRGKHQIVDYIGRLEEILALSDNDNNIIELDQ